QQIRQRVREHGRDQHAHRVGQTRTQAPAPGESLSQRNGSNVRRAVHAIGPLPGLVTNHSDTDTAIHWRSLRFVTNEMNLRGRNRSHVLQALLLAAALALAACAPQATRQSAPAAGTKLHLALLETTDIHTNVLSYDYFKLAEDKNIGFERAAE